MTSPTTTADAPIDTTPTDINNTSHTAIATPTTPTTSDYLSILHSFSMTGPEASSGLSVASPLINLNLLPSPIDFSGLPEIVTSFSDQKSVSASCIDFNTAIVKGELEQPLEKLITPVAIPAIKFEASTEVSEPLSATTMPKLAQKSIKRLQQKIKKESFPQDNAVRRSSRKTQKIEYNDDDADTGNNDENDVENYAENDHNEEEGRSDAPNEPQTQFVTKADVRDPDVLSGRGLASSKHPGNVLFRQLVYKYKPAYEQKLSISFRQGLAKKIVDEIHPGRFIKMEGPNFARVLDYEASITKALFAMRDCKKCMGDQTINFDIDSIIPFEEPLPKRKRGKTYAQSTSMTSAAAVKKNVKKQKLDGKSIKTVKKSAKSPKHTSKMSEPRGKTVTPPKLPRSVLSLSEVRRIKSLIETSINPDDETKLPYVHPETRSEEIHAFIEEMVSKGAEIRRNAGSQIMYQDWFHPQMQRCIRLQILQRCRIAMQTTGMSHTEFFDKLFHLELFP